MRERRIAIVGVGLIGGSLGLALKRSGFDGIVEGYGRRQNTLDLALQLGAVDVVSLDLRKAGQSDIVVICTPVEVIPEMVERIASEAKPGCVITDVGSIKRRVVERVEMIIESLSSPASFVGAHPMAGSEKSGVLAARADLFEGAKCILTPTDSTSKEAIRAVQEMWRLVGAETLILSPQEHDRLVAASSHLVHLSASALVETVSKVNGALDLAASGFKDTTRIASGLPSLWKGILLQNADMLLPMIDKLIDVLIEYKTLLATNDVEELERKLEIAKRIRDSVS